MKKRATLYDVLIMGNQIRNIKITASKVEIQLINAIDMLGGDYIEVEIDYARDVPMAPRLKAALYSLEDE